MFDEKCYELAGAFLEDEPASIQTEEHRNALAQVIQDAIEQELEAMKFTPYFTNAKA